MNSQSSSEKIENLLKIKRISKEDIQIWGGEVNGNELKDFLIKWMPINMPYVIMETLKEFTITSNFNFSNIEPELIERIRIFGKAGDLDLRRNSTYFMWRYVGENNLPSDVKGNNFWADNPNIFYFMEEKDALLWGKFEPSKKMWHDNRVAKAKLLYPINGNPERVKIHYKTLSESGQISFLWFTEIKGWIHENQER